MQKDRSPVSVIDDSVAFCDKLHVILESQLKRKQKVLKIILFLNK